MKTTDNAHKACDKCKYFSLRYYKANYTFIVALGDGCCGIRRYTEEERKKLPYGFVCDKWTPRAGEITDISEIKNELGDITAKLILIVKALSKEF